MLGTPPRARPALVSEILTIVTTVLVDFTPDSRVFATEDESVAVGVLARGPEKLEQLLRADSMSRPLACSLCMGVVHVLFVHGRLVGEDCADLGVLLLLHLDELGLDCASDDESRHLGLLVLPATVCAAKGFRS